METVTNTVTAAASTATNVATNVATVASRAIWGEPANETAGKEPVSGEVGDVKSGEPYDKGNEEPTTSTVSEPKSLTKTTSREITSTDSSVDLPSTSNSKTPAETTAREHLTSPTETLATTQIEPLKDEKSNPEVIAAGGTSLAQQVKTGSSGTDSTGAEDKVKNLSLKEYEQQTSGVKTLDADTTKIGSTKGTDDLTTHTGAPATTHTGASSSTHAPINTTSSTSTSDSKDKDHKLSLKEKIKAKLHKH